MTQAKVIKMSGYLYRTKDKHQPFKLVSATENVIELVVQDKDVSACQDLIWEEVDVVGEKTEGVVINLISIVPRSKSPLAG